MPNTTKKLASTFKAWRITLEVEPELLMKIVDNLLKLNLNPKPCGWEKKISGLEDEPFKRIQIVFVVPQEKVSNPVLFVENHLEGNHASLCGFTPVDMICPPAQEMGGGCRHCGELVLLEMSPFHYRGQPAFVVSEHKSFDSICPGSGSEPWSKIGLKRLS